MEIEKSGRTIFDQFEFCLQVFINFAMGKIGMDSDSDSLDSFDAVDTWSI